MAYVPPNDMMAYEGSGHGILYVRLRVLLQ